MQTLAVMNIYCIGGLAADCRIFKYITLQPSWRMHYLDFIDALPNESLSSYANRMATMLDKSSQYCIIGFSFGGMLAVEMAKTHSPSAIVLMASVPRSSELPSMLRIAGRLRLHKIMPAPVLKELFRIKRLIKYRHCKDKELLVSAVEECNPTFLKWSLDAILKWRNTIVPRGCFHIHGSKDVVLPMRRTKPTHVVNGAGHLFLMEKPEEVNDILRRILNCVQNDQPSEITAINSPIYARVDLKDAI